MRRGYLDDTLKPCHRCLLDFAWPRQHDRDVIMKDGEYTHPFLAPLNDPWVSWKWQGYLSQALPCMKCFCLRHCCVNRLRLYTMGAAASNKCLCSPPPPPLVCEQTLSTWSHLQCSDRSGVLKLKTLNAAIPFGFLAPTSLCDFWWTSHKWRWTCPVYCPTTSVLVLKLFLYCALQIDQQAALVGQVAYIQTLFFFHLQTGIKCHTILLKTTNTTQKILFLFFKLRYGPFGLNPENFANI